MGPRTPRVPDDRGPTRVRVHQRPVQTKLQIRAAWRTVARRLPSPVRRRRTARLGGPRLSAWGAENCVSSLTALGLSWSARVCGPCKGCTKGLTTVLTRRGRCQPRDRRTLCVVTPGATFLRRNPPAHPDTRVSTECRYPEAAGKGTAMGTWTHGRSLSDGIGSTVSGLCSSCVAAVPGHGQAEDESATTDAYCVERGSMAGRPACAFAPRRRSREGQRVSCRARGFTPARGPPRAVPRAHPSVHPPSPVW
jgi:hypothetical protein